LVEKYLVGVISLPSGVFQPYSGVKTSILILDKELSQKTDKIFFGKVDNDGFDLGSQRREIDKNDLPILTKEVTEYLEGLRKGKVVESEKLTYVPKEHILGSSDFNLSSIIYNKIIPKNNSSFPLVKLKELITIQSGFAFDSSKFNESKGFPLIRIRNIKKDFTDTLYDGEILKDYIVRNGDLLIGMDGEFNCSIWNGNEALLNQRVCRITSYKDTLREYVFYNIKHKLKEIEDETFAVTVKHISSKQILEIEIPLPPIEVQKEIVRELEQYQNIIDGARQVVDNYKPVIDIDSSWEMILLKDLLKLSSGKGLVKRDMIDGQYEVFGGNGISGFHNSYFIEEKTIVIGRVGEYCGVVHITSPKCWITDNGLYVTNYYKEIKLEYLSIILTSLNLNSYAKVGGQPSISQSTILELSIPYPSIEIQQSIVDRIEAERLIIEGNKKLIEIYTKKIQERINNIWGE
jgi:type I restriction enzyme M protein